MCAGIWAGASIAHFYIRLAVADRLDHVVTRSRSASSFAGTRVNFSLRTAPCVHARPRSRPPSPARLPAACGARRPTAALTSTGPTAAESAGAASGVVSDGGTSSPTFGTSPLDTISDLSGEVPTRSSRRSRWVRLRRRRVAGPQRRDRARRHLARRARRRGPRDAGAQRGRCGSLDRVGGGDRHARRGGPRQERLRRGCQAPRTNQTAPAPTITVAAERSDQSTDPNHQPTYGRALLTGRARASPGVPTIALLERARNTPGDQEGVGTPEPTDRAASPGPLVRLR